MKTYKTDRTFGEKLKGIEYKDRVGAYIIIIKDGALAATKAPKGYYLPGGGIKDGESHLECIAREAKEEAGYEVKVVSYLCLADKYWKNGEKGYFHPVQYYYVGELLGKNGEPQEHDTEFAWLPIEEIEEKMVVDAQIWAVNKLLKTN